MYQLIYADETFDKDLNGDLQLYCGVTSAKRANKISRSDKKLHFTVEEIFPISASKVNTGNCVRWE